MIETNKLRDPEEWLHWPPRGIVTKEHPNALCLLGQWTVSANPEYYIGVFLRTKTDLSSYHTQENKGYFESQESGFLFINIIK